MRASSLERTFATKSCLADQFESTTAGAFHHILGVAPSPQIHSTTTALLEQNPVNLFYLACIEGHTDLVKCLTKGNPERDSPIVLDSLFNATDGSQFAPLMICVDLGKVNEGLMD